MWASANLVVPADTLAGGRARGGESHQRQHEQRDTSHPGGHFRFSMIINVGQGGPANVEKIATTKIIISAKIQQYILYFYVELTNSFFVYIIYWRYKHLKYILIY